MWNWRGVLRNRRQFYVLVRTYICKCFFSVRKIIKTLSPFKYVSQCLWIGECNSLDVKSSFRSRQTSEMSVLLVVDLGRWMCSVAQSCPTLCDPKNCSPPGSSVHGIVQARILEWIAIPFSRGSSSPRDWTWVSCITAGRFWCYHLSRQESPIWGNLLYRLQVLQDDSILWVLNLWFFRDCLCISWLS